MFLVLHRIEVITRLYVKESETFPPATFLTLLDPKEFFFVVCRINDKEVSFLGDFNFLFHYCRHCLLITLKQKLDCITSLILIQSINIAIDAEKFNLCIWQRSNVALAY